jgi:uncharacterized membrane protein YesL
MLGILFVYFLGKYFYELAIFYNKNKWLYAILGVVSYYVGVLLGGMLLACFSMLLSIEVDWDNQLLMSFLAIPFGLGMSYLLYQLLKRKLSSKLIMEKSINDINKNGEQSLD